MHGRENPLPLGCRMYGFFTNNDSRNSDLECKSSDAFLTIQTLHLTLSILLVVLRNVGMHGHSDP